MTIISEAARKAQIIVDLSVYHPVYTPAYKGFFSSKLQSDQSPISKLNPLFRTFDRMFLVIRLQNKILISGDS